MAVNCVIFLLCFLLSIWGLKLFKQSVKLQNVHHSCKLFFAYKSKWDDFRKCWLKRWQSTVQNFHGSQISSVHQPVSRFFFFWFSRPESCKRILSAVTVVPRLVRDLASVSVEEVLRTGARQLKMCRGSGPGGASQRLAGISKRGLN